MKTPRTDSEMIMQLLGSARSWLESDASEDRNVGIFMCLGDLDPLEIYQRRLSNMCPRELRREYDKYREDFDTGEDLEDEEDTE